MHITMIGSGYVGLVSSACLASFGHQVTCVDNNRQKIDALNRGALPLYEPGLDTLVADNASAGRLRFTTELGPAVAEAEAVFVAVGTPSRRGDGYADLCYVREAAREIARSIRDFTVVVIKSTVPVGTGDEVERIIREENPHADFAVVSNPEFLREGAAIEDFRRPDRVVVGLEDERARAVMTEVYRPLSLNKAPVMFTSRRTSELIKYAANAFLAMKITFINEIADLCEQVQADVQEVSRGIGLDKRIGPKFLHAGPGFGGSCFPKDTLALMKTAHDFGSHLRLVETTIAVNDHRKRAMSRKVVAACGGDVHGKTIAVLGLTFKPETDDMRESPAIDIIRALQDSGARVKAFDPAGLANAPAFFEGTCFATSAYDCVKDAEAAVIVTEWNTFRALDFPRMKALMKTPILVDLRNIYHHEEVTRHGFRYESVGRPVQVPSADAEPKRLPECVSL